MKYHVYISHKIEDEFVVRTLKSALEVLSKFRLEIHFSGEMPHGSDWRKWTESNILRSDLLIFLYTSAESEKDWRWCIYEIGIFQGNKIFKRKISDTDKNQISTGYNVLCIKHPYIHSPPMPIENIQVCDADEPGIRKLFEQLLYEKCKFSEEPLITDRDQNLFSEQVDKVVRSFNPPVKINFFEKRLIITLSEIEDNEIKEKDLENSDLTGNPDTMAFLKLPEQGAKWERLYKSLKSKGQHTWMDQISESIDNIKKQRNPIDVLQPITMSKGEVWFPIITRIERFQFIKNKEEIIIPKQISLIFAAMPNLSSFAQELPKAKDTEEHLKQMKEALRSTAKVAEVLKYQTEQLRSTEKEIRRLKQVTTIKSHWGSKDLPIDKDLCFLLMPFSEPWSDYVWKLINRTVRDCGYRCERADEKDGRVIMEDIWSGICRAQFVIADLSGKNPNVTYEVGLSDVIGKKVILLSQTPREVPFDFLGQRLITYEDSIKGEQKLSEDLKKRLGTIEADNKNKP